MCSSYIRLGKHLPSLNQRRISNSGIFYVSFEGRFSQDGQSGRGSPALRVFQAVGQRCREGGEIFWDRSIGRESISRKIPDR